MTFESDHALLKREEAQAAAAAAHLKSTTTAFCPATPETAVSVNTMAASRNDVGVEKLY